MRAEEKRIVISLVGWKFLATRDHLRVLGQAEIVGFDLLIRTQ
jgi:hypothetical protein